MLDESGECLGERFGLYPVGVLDIGLGIRP